MKIYRVTESGQVISVGTRGKFWTVLTFSSPAVEATLKLYDGDSPDSANRILTIRANNNLPSVAIPKEISFRNGLYAEVSPTKGVEAYVYTK